MAVVFFSYSHADEALRDKLEQALAVLKRQGFVEAWHDRRIPAGDELDGTIDDNINKADIILMLLSPDFIASDYCYDVEMKRAIERHDAGEARVIPVILRPCMWHQTPLAKLNAIPKDGLPVTKHADQDDAFLEIGNAIQSIVKDQPKSSPLWKSAAHVESASAPTSRTMRTSNLRVKKTFTAADELKFLDDSFEYVALFFQNSLAELEKRTPGLTYRYKIENANEFSVIVFVGGSPVTQCRIFRNTMIGDGIAYSDNYGRMDNSFNENLRVGHDDQHMTLSPTMGSEPGSSHLSQSGAAEYLWARLIKRLQ